MKTNRLRHLLTIAALTGALASAAQDAMMDIVKRLSARYPSAEQRYETRTSQSQGNRVRRETRYDLRISRDLLTAAERQQLVAAYQREWQRRSLSGDKSVLHVDGDSVSCTIVYGLPQGSGATIDAQTLFSNRGFLMYDQGRDFRIKVSKVERYAATLRQPDLSGVRQLFSHLAGEREAVATSVRYTGSKGHFCFQRGEGRGWTRGTRYAISHPQPTDFADVRRAITACADGRAGAEVIAYNDFIILHNELGKDIFMAKLDAQGRLFLLQATDGDEPCVPYDWTTLDFLCNGQTKWVDVSRLDSLCDAISGRADARHTPVQYTGCGSEGCPGFQWQRGNGTGWTRGTRVSLPYDSLTEQEIRQNMMLYQGKLRLVNVEDNYITTYEEGTKTFYGYRHDGDSLFLLRAATSGEICVPIDWPTRTFYEGPHGRADKKFGDASSATLRMLGLGRLWAGVKRNFVYYDKLSFDWDSLYAAYIPQMQQVSDDGEATRLLQKMAAHLGDGHTFVWGVDYGTALPLTTRLVGGKVYIDGIYNAGLAEMGLRRGAEITRIDGTDVMDYAREHLFPLISSSTPQWTLHKAFDGDMLTTKPDGHGIKIETLHDGAAQSFDIARIDEYEWESFPAQDDLSFQMLDGNVGYLKISSFNNDQVREEFDRVWPEIMRSHALIIDLRDNGGGNSQNGDYILSHLSNDSIRKGDWDSPLYCPALASWGVHVDNHGGKDNYIYPAKGKQHYDKAIVTLINRGTFSAAEDFCSSLAWLQRGPLIGQPTGGSTGNGVQVELIPHRCTANICAKHDLAADGTEFVGIGIQPTIAVEETWDTEFPDSAVSAALHWLAQQRK